MSNRRYYNRQTRNRHERILARHLTAISKKPEIASKKLGGISCEGFYNNPDVPTHAKGDRIPYRMTDLLTPRKARTGYKASPASYRKGSQPSKPYHHGKITRLANETLKLVSTKKVS